MKTEPLARYLRRPTQRRFDAVVKEYYEFVWRTAFRLTRHADDAADLCHDVFLRLCRDPPEADRVRSARGYLSWRVLSRFSHLRDAAERRLRREREHYRRCSVVNLTPQDTRTVHEAIRDLPEALRVTVQLRYLAEYSAAEIAQILGVSEQAVHQRLRNAREALKRRLAPAFATALCAVVPGSIGVPPPPVTLLGDLCRVAAVTQAQAAAGGIAVSTPGLLHGLWASGTTTKVCAGLAAAALIIPLASIAFPPSQRESDPGSVAADRPAAASRALARSPAVTPPAPHRSQAPGAATDASGPAAHAGDPSEEAASSGSEAGPRFQRLGPGSRPGSLDDIRRRRLLYIEQYVETLFGLAKSCAKRGFRRDGIAIVRRARAAYDRPTEQRLSSRKTGELTDADADADGSTATGAAFVEAEAPRSPAEQQQFERHAAVAKNLLASLQAPESSTALESTADSSNETLRAAADAARRRFTKQLGRLGEECLHRGFGAHGCELLFWALQLDPTSRAPRQTLRQIHANDRKTGERRWYQPFEAALLRDGLIDDPVYGWIKPRDLRRLDSGLRPYRDEWLPEHDVEAALEDWQNRWVHRTEHCEIHTSLSLEDAVELGREIELHRAMLFRVWADFFGGNHRSAVRLFAVSVRSKSAANKLRIHYHRTRESFLRELESDATLRPLATRDRAQQSTGFYWRGNGWAYFHGGATGPDYVTVFHELTHQILDQTVKAGASPPVWLVEGMAVYSADPLVRGTRTAGTRRFVAGARRPSRASRDESESEAGIPGEPPLIPNLAAFLTETRSHEGFHREPQHRDNYATAGATVHFFLHHRGGIYRKPFISYAREAYRNDADEQPTAISQLYRRLAEEANTSEAELQAEWVSFHESPELFDF